MANTRKDIEFEGDGPKPSRRAGRWSGDRKNSEADKDAAKTDAPPDH